LEFYINKAKKIFFSFYLSGIINNKYLKTEVRNLARYLTIACGGGNVSSNLNKTNTAKNLKNDNSYDLINDKQSGFFGTRKRYTSWQKNHSYILADRWEDVTPSFLINKDPLVDRSIAFFGMYFLF
jgi:hypothetical protein